MTVETVDNTVDSEAFLDFLRGTLIPELHPFDGYTPMSITIAQFIVCRRFKSS